MEAKSDAALRALAQELSGTAYRPTRLLARGGMGEVVVVEHVELGRAAVMKLIRENVAERTGTSESELSDRLRAEGRVLARLSHPNLVAVLDSGRTASGKPFIVTELLVGETLADYVRARGGHLPVVEALELALQALAGLAVVHEAGFVHRDLKLANLFVLEAPPGARRHLKVLDFGIVKAISAEERQALGLIKPTGTGVVLGTPSAVSPEQVRGRPVDERTDVYGLGVVLFRMVTGRGPFSGSAVELFTAHLGDAPPVPSQVAAQRVPESVDRLILKALAKNPDDRFQGARSMRAEVEAVVAALGHATPSVDIAPPVAPTPAATSVASGLRAKETPYDATVDSTTAHGTRFGQASLREDAEPTSILPAQPQLLGTRPLTRQLAAHARSPRRDEVNATPRVSSPRWPIFAALVVSAVVLIAAWAWTLR